MSDITMMTCGPSRVENCGNLPRLATRRDATRYMPTPHDLHHTWRNDGVPSPCNYSPMTSSRRHWPAFGGGGGCSNGLPCTKKKRTKTRRGCHNDSGDNDVMIVMMMAMVTTGCVALLVARFVPGVDLGLQGVVGPLSCPKGRR